MDITARVNHRKTWNSTLIHDGSDLEISKIKFFILRFGGVIQIPNSQDLTIRSQAHDAVLTRGESNVGVATFTRWKRDTAFLISDEKFLIEAVKGSRGSSFSIKKLDGEAVEIGVISRKGFFRWSDAIVLNEWVAVESVSFMYWCALWHYRRQYIFVSAGLGVTLAALGQIFRVVFKKIFAGTA